MIAAKCTAAVGERWRGVRAAEFACVQAVFVRVCGRVVAATYKCNPCVQGS